MTSIQVPNILDMRYKRIAAFPTGIRVLDQCFVSRMKDAVGFPKQGKILLTGANGLGKTTLVLQILDGLTSHGCFTILATNESTTNSIVGLAKAISLKHGVNYILEDQINSADMLESITKLVKEYKLQGRQLVLAIDSLQGFNLDQQNPTRKAWVDLEEFTKKTGAIIIVINHLRKDGVMGGAAILRQRCDAVLKLVRGSDQTLAIEIEKNRFGIAGVEIVGMTMTPNGVNFADASPPVETGKSKED